MAASRPSAPSNFQALPLDGKVLCIWDKPDTDGGSAITDYILSYTPDINKISTGSTFTNYTLELTNGITYTINVKARNSAGIIGDASTPVIVSPVSQSSSTIVRKQVTTLPYTKFNNTDIPGLDDRTLTGLMNISRATTTEVYTTAIESTLPASSALFTDCYPVIADSTNTVVLFRSSKRKYDEVYNYTDKSYSYGSLFGNNSATNALLNREAVYRTLESLYPSSVINDPTPDSNTSMRTIVINKVVDHLLLTGCISDAVKLLQDNILNHNNNPVTALVLNKDYGRGSVTMWEENKKGALDIFGGIATYNFLNIFAPNWAYEYIHSRPILTFDTRTDTGGFPLTSDKVIGAKLVVKKYNGSTVANTDNLSIKVYSANKSYNPLTKTLNFADYTSADIYAGTISLSDSKLLAGETIEIDLAKEVIAAGDYTTLTFKSSLEIANLLPTGWNQIWLNDISLVLLLNSGSGIRPTGPMPVSTVKTSPGSTQIGLTWSEPSDTGGSPISHYLLEEIQDKKSILYTSSTTSAIFSSLTTNTSYDFHLHAINAIDISSAKVITEKTTSNIDPVHYNTPDAVSELVWQTGNQQIDLKWSPPLSDGGSPITAYIIKNNVDATIRTTGPIPVIQSFKELINGKPYKYRIAAINSLGEGAYKETAVLIPVAGNNIPDPPTNVVAIAYGLAARISWLAPTDGGSPINSILITAYPDHEAIRAINLTGNQTAYLFSNLSLNESYTFSVILTNAKGQSHEVFSNKITIVENQTLVFTQDINYKKFYVAPVELNPQADNYLSFLYEKSLFEYLPCFINGNNISWPVEITAENNKLLCTVGTETLEYNFPIGTYTQSDIVATLNANSNSLFEVEPLLDKIVVRSLLKTSEGAYTNIVLEKVQNNEEVLNLIHDTIFGINVEIIPATALPLVENYVPTVEHDFKNKKALAEAQPYITIRDKDILSFDSILANETTTEIKYSLDLQHKNIKPGSTAITWANENNSKVKISDYLYDGRLLIKSWTKDPETDQISYNYLPSKLHTGLHFGRINYQTGEITDLQFAKPEDIYADYNYSSAALIGHGVKFPVTFLTSKTLYIKINNVEYNYVIPGNYTYTLEQLITYLNTHAGGIFQQNGFIAASTSGQLVIKVAAKPAPNKILTFSDRIYSNDIKVYIFGLNPIIRYPSSIKVTTTYTSYIDNKYNYVWYQTPHFVIKLKNYSNQYFTKSHFDYLISKIPLLKPAETVFDQLRINSVLEDKCSITEDLYIRVYDNVIPPYLLCEPLPPVNEDPLIAFSYVGKLLNVQVTNPDYQDSNVLHNSYRYR